MKKHEITFSVIKIPLDFCIVFSSFFIARSLREITDLIPGISLPIQTISNNGLSYFALLGSFLFIGVFALHWLYSIKISHSKVKEFLDILWYSSYFFMFFSLFVYLWNGIVYSEEIPRLVILFATIMSAVFIIMGRIILNQIQSFFIKKWTIKKRTMLIITNKKHEKNKRFIEDIKSARIYTILWYINAKSIDEKKQKYLGSLKEFYALAKSGKIDEILYIDSDFSKQDLYKIWDECRIYGIRYRYVTNYFDITASNTTLTLINSIPVIEIKNTSLENWGRVWKRIFDAILAVILIILLFPLFLIIAILIKIENPKAPIIYKNKRVWTKWKEFFLYKFRYLKWEYCIRDNDNTALALEKKLIQEKSDRKWPLYKIKDDPRKSSIWCFIEKYSIDELPQLFNVLIGNMSLVWPRPHQPREVDKYKMYQKRVLTIKPGITGMGQINGRDKNTFDKEVKLDIFYIENWSLLLDIKIIFKTLPIIFQRK